MIKQKNPEKEKQSGRAGLRPEAYLKDHFLVYLLHLSCSMLLCAFLLLTGYTKDFCIIILICWLLVLLVWSAVSYYDRKRYFRQMYRVLEKVDQRFLLGELMPASVHLEDRLYREIIQKSNKSVIERIHKIEEEQRDYREYIESWVHEIKAPITNISLICENGRKGHQGPDKREFSEYIAIENQKVENFVDMALYYARSDEVYKDYLICKTNLQELAAEVILKNKYMLLQNHMQAGIQCEGQKAFTDRKWIAFILNQLILNSVKYRREENPHIWITAEKYEGGVRLSVEDNGIGIKAEELPRIFEKGFTGTNGRTHEHATGMGLYLCRKLCGKLGIGISARSEYGKGTGIILEFPVSGYILKT